MTEPVSNSSEANQTGISLKIIDDMIEEVVKIPNLTTNNDEQKLIMSPEIGAKLIMSVGEEVIGGDRLLDLLKKKPCIRAYDGFEPSGRIHVAQGLVRTINVNKMTKAGVKFVFWIADYFALLNLKMGGNMDRIRKAGELMIHTWRGCGMDMTNVEFIWASQEIEQRSAEYWSLVFDIATKMSVKRILKCTQIMGRKDFTEKPVAAENKNDPNYYPVNASVNANVENNANNENEEEEGNAIPYDKMLSDMKLSQMFYPAMQCADIPFLNIDICSLGMDQRKVNMLAIEYYNLTRRKFKPIIVSHHMLSGLDGSDKMAKGNPDAAIFMDDTDQDVNLKIKKAFCEPGNIVKNPILEYFKYIVFEKELVVELPVNDHATKTSKIMSYDKYVDLENDFLNLTIHPSDLKTGIKLYLKKYLDPVRKYFEDHPEADALRKEVKKFATK